MLKRAKQVFEIVFFALLCSLIPVKKNRIAFSCHGGKGLIGCNPKYVCAEIIKQKLPYEIIWITDDKSYEFENVEIINNKNFFKKMLALASAKIWIENALKTSDYQKGLFKKKNQIYINTWHGSFGIKKMFFDTNNFNDNSIWAKFFKKEINEIDYMLASTKWEEDIYRSGLRFKGEVLKIGNPRNDLFFKENEIIRKKIFNYFKIDDSKKILLYAPTFRDNRNFDININFFNLKKVLKEKFNQDFVIFSRKHIEQKNKVLSDDFIDVSFYPDIQELLVASDILISDYSSCMFDFMLLKKPCFVFASDLGEFIKERGFYYPLDSTPFLIAKNNDELFENISKFDSKKYQKQCVEFILNKNVLNDGLSSKRAVELIKKVICK